MDKLHFGWTAGTALIMGLYGCAPTAQDSSGAREADRQVHSNGSNGAAGEKAHDDLRPTRLENCLTAVGADRSRCSASN